MDREGIRKACMALPGVTLEHPFGDDHDAYKVGGRMFAIVGGEGGVSFKVSDIAFEVLTGDGRARPLPEPAAWPDDELAGHFTTAHAIIAAKLTKTQRSALGLA